jgi:hypothetical protein
VRVAHGHGVEAALLDRRDLRRREPMLGPRVVGGAWLRDDHSVDPRRVLAGACRLGQLSMSVGVRVFSSSGGLDDLGSEGKDPVPKRTCCDVRARDTGPAHLEGIRASPAQRRDLNGPR